MTTSMYKYISLFLLMFFGICSNVSAVSTTCMDFDSYPLGTQYVVGDNQSYGTIYGEFTPFQWSNGSWTSGGVATIENGGQARGSGNEINLNNINIRFMFGTTQPVVATFKYADWGGNINLGINGTLSNRNNLSDLNGSIINGVLILVTRTNVFGGHYGTVALIGLTSSIDRFAVGGQEFWVDDICVSFP